MSSTWLADLKPGDEVAYSVAYGRIWRFDTVAKVTATQIALCGHTKRFSRDTGEQIGGDRYGSSYARLWSPDNARKRIQDAEDAKTEAEKKRDRIRKIESLLPKLTVEQLDAILNVVERPTHASPPPLEPE